LVGGNVIKHIIDYSSEAIHVYKPPKTLPQQFVLGKPGLFWGSERCNEATLDHYCPVQLSSERRNIIARNGL
jgi:hypothetical protein